MRWSSRISPDIAEVTVRAPAARTPRSDMQACSASMTTPTPPGCQVAAEPSGYLRRQPLLRLQAPGGVLDDPGQRRQPGQASPGKVADVRHPAEGQQVMRAQ